MVWRYHWVRVRVWRYRWVRVRVWRYSWVRVRVWRYSWVRVRVWRYSWVRVRVWRYSWVLYYTIYVILLWISLKQDTLKTQTLQKYFKRLIKIKLSVNWPLYNLWRKSFNNANMKGKKQRHILINCSSRKNKYLALNWHL